MGASQTHIRPSSIFPCAPIVDLTPNKQIVRASATLLPRRSRTVRRPHILVLWNPVALIFNNLSDRLKHEREQQLGEFSHASAVLINVKHESAAARARENITCRAAMPREQRGMHKAYIGNSTTGRRSGISPGAQRDR